MNYDGHTRTCGLIGNPVEHTLSPLIHNTLAEVTDTNLVYVPFHVRDGLVGDAVRGAYALNLLGCNVTVPYKSEVIPFLKELDPLAARIGAVNTLVRIEGGYKGYNTDMPGLYRAMVQDGVRLEGRTVVILGAGGVARAVAILLLEKRAERVYILNRTKEKAARVAEEVNAFAGRGFVQALSLTEYDKLPAGINFLTVQATNVGMYPRVEEVLISDPAFYERVEIGYDLIFNPADTKFMKLVRANGGRAYNGMRMLLYQGIIAYELWNQTGISEDTAEQIYQAMAEALR